MLRMTQQELKNELREIKLAKNNKIKKSLRDSTKEMELYQLNKLNGNNTLFSKTQSTMGSSDIVTEMNKTTGKVCSKNNL